MCVYVCVCPVLAQPTGVSSYNAHISTKGIILNLLETPSAVIFILLYSGQFITLYIYILTTGNYIILQW